MHSTGNVHDKSALPPESGGAVDLSMTLDGLGRQVVFKEWKR